LPEAARLAEEAYRRRIVADEENRMIFTNDAMREYVISQMSVLEKAATHLSAGRTLEREGGVSAGALATHFFLGDEWPRCFSYAMEAATLARNSGGNAEAAHFAEIAATAATGSDERRTALVLGGDSMFALGNSQAAAANFSEVLNTVAPPALSERIRVHLSLAAVRIEACNWRAANNALRDVEAQILSIDDLSARMRFKAEHASLALKLALRTGDQASIAGLEKLLSGLVSDLGKQKEPDPETAMSILMAAAVLESLTGSGQEAVRHLASAQAFLGSARPTQLARYFGLRGLVRTRLASWDAAEADFREARQIAAKLGDQVALMRLSNNLACVSLGTGDWDVAAQRLGEAETIHSRIASESDVKIPVALNRANLLFYQGFLSEACAAYTGIEDLCRQQRSLEHLPEVTACRGLIALQRGSTTEAEELWRELGASHSEDSRSVPQERFKLEWFAAAMHSPTNGRNLLIAAADEADRDVPGHLKLLTIDAIMLRRDKRQVSDVRASLQERGMGWFYSFVRRWHRMSGLG
jgi:tetratricopeptide (TPR) repeat protein